MMRPTSDGAVALKEGLMALARALARLPERGVVALLEVPIHAQMAVTAALEALCEREGIAEESAVIVHVRDDEAVRAELRVLNRERDLRLRHQRMIVVIAADAEALRVAREVAPDLLASPDLRLTIETQARPGREDPVAMRSEICELMRRRHRELDLTGLLPGAIERRKVPLDQLFMELADYQGWSSKSSWTRVRRTTEQQSQLQLFSEEVVSAPVKERRATLVLADPGAGKTTLLRRLAVVYAEGLDDPLNLKVGTVTPLLVPLAELARARETDRVRPLPELLGAWLAAQGVEDRGWRNKVMPGVLLLLDGVDEVPEVAVRRILVDEAIALAEEQAIAAVVLTGRSFLVDELRVAIERCQLLRIRAPEREEVQRYLLAFIRLRGAEERAEERAEEKARALTERIWGDRDLRALVATPLLLLFLALLYEFEGRLPDRRVEIYNRLSELLVDRWVHARSLARSVRARSISRGEVQQVLGPLAWWIVQRGGAAASRAEIKAQLVTQLSRREEVSVAEEQAESLLKILQDHSALLRRAPRGRWAFVHHSVAEFFAAREAERDQERWDRLVEEPFDPLWREVVLFAAGIAGVERGNLGRVDALIAAVLRGARRSGRYEARHPSLLVGLLREDPQLSRRQQVALLGRLSEFWFENAFYPTSGSQVQAEALSFLEWAVGSRHAPLVSQVMGRYFGGEGTGPDPTEAGQRRSDSDRPDPIKPSKPIKQIRWDRLLVASAFLFPSNPGRRWLEELRSAVGESRFGRMLVGPLIWGLIRLLPEYSLDSARLRGSLAQEDDWRLRWVAEHGAW